MKHILKTTNLDPKVSEQDLLVNARKVALQTKKPNEQPEIEWLTENSRKFLEAGYLTDGITPEARICINHIFFKSN